MKKIAILSSLLALTACGGGSGGGAGAPAAVVDLSDAQRAAQASNENVTGMNSFVIVGGSNPTVAKNSRSASSGVKLADGGIMYDLSNVKLHTTTFTEDFVDPDAGAFITFKTDDNGKIIEIAATGPKQFPDGIVGKRNSDDSKHFTGDIVFNSYHEKHDEHGNLVRDEHDNVVYEENILTFPNFKMNYNSFGKDVGLSYSDFGSLGLATAEEELSEDGEFFAGGYEVKKIDPKYIDANPTFTGIARGTVSVGYDDEDPTDIKLRDNAAKLNFVDGQSTLNAKFDNWYDVSATMDNNGKLSGIEFTNGNKENFANGYKFNGTDSNGHYTAMPTQYVPGTGPNAIREGFVEYYGDNNNPSEAVGVMKYAESHGGKNDVSDNTLILFDMGFGVTKD